MVCLTSPGCVPCSGVSFPHLPRIRTEEQALEPLVAILQRGGVPGGELDLGAGLVVVGGAFDVA